jgi:predicted RNA methylase
MRLRQLESHLQKVKGFTNPKVKWEQYSTTPHIAAHLLYTIHNTYGDIEDKIVADFGIGSGILSVGAALLGCSYVIGIDIDEDALQLAQSNFEYFEIENFELLKADLRHASLRTVYQTSPFDSMKILVNDLPTNYNNPIHNNNNINNNVTDDASQSASESCSSEEADSPQPSTRKQSIVDTVIMNPPFGTKIKGVDSIFLEKAFEMASTAVYSLHKTSTRDFIIKKATRCGAKVNVLAELRFDIPQMYQFHKQKSVDIEVDFLRFDVRNIFPSSEHSKLKIDK